MRGVLWLGLAKDLLLKDPYCWCCNGSPTPQGAARLRFPVEQVTQATRVSKTGPGSPAAGSVIGSWHQPLTHLPRRCQG